MGTRSLTVFVEDNKEICVMYRQFDGYPSGHGQDLAKFLSGMSIVNGFNSSTPAKAANGMSCLTGQVIANFKDGIGGIYIYPAKTRNCGEDYIYIVTAEDGSEPVIEVIEAGWSGARAKTLQKGPASKVLDWCQNDEG